MSNPSVQEFGKWRGFFWPVHRFELKKLFPMLVIFFLISFNYNVLRILKDSLIVTAKSSGAEVIPFIKVWALFPGALILTATFSYFSSHYSRERVFYLMVGIFLSYFTLFACLYPFSNALHPHETADWLLTVLPKGFYGLVAMFRYWLFTSFYVMSELWGSVLLTVLFWGFANQVTKLDEAKRFYALFGMGANFSGVFAGQISIYFLNHTFNPALPFGQTAWDQSLMFILMMILTFGVLALGVFRWFNKVVLQDPRYYDAAAAHEKDLQGHVSLKENFAYLFRSRYLTCIALIVFSYNVVINLVEVLWKHEVRLLYPNPSDYSVYMNQVSSVIGAVATISALVVSGNAIKKFGWTFTALLTPVILFVTSILFFGFLFIDSGLIAFPLETLLLGASPLTFVVFFGTLQNVMSRGAKYTVFDATKEMAYVPLPPEVKLNGKASIDGVCSRMGKSGGAFIHQTLLLLFSTLSASAPYVGVALFSIIGVWILATKALGRQFNEITAPEKEKPVVATTLA